MKNFENPASAKPSIEASSALCLTCGLCCDGTLFGNVELQLGDDVDDLRRLGLDVSTRGKPKFPQPCSALQADCQCGVYAERPQQCRAFECALLQSVKAGRVSVAAAGQIIRRTRKQASRVRQVLGELGEGDERRALAKRFHRLKHRFELGELDAGPDREAMIDAFAGLTWAVHELQFALRREFYPDPSDMMD